MTRSKRSRGRAFALGISGTIAAIAACGHDDGPAQGRSAPDAVVTSVDARQVLDRVRATFPGAARELADEGVRAPRGVRARVELPRSSREATRVTDAASGVTVAFHLQGTRDGAMAAAGEVRVLRDALPGGHLLHVARPDGVEDFVAFDARPADESLAYSVDVSRVAGLRVVGRQLEMLDAGGAPRLRVAPPYAIDAGGRHIDAAIDVVGCAVDRDPREPWGRAVVPPGASSCEVRVRWASATYPLLVDPSWTTTGALSVARRRHAVVTLPSGRPFAIGGTSATATMVNTPLATTDVYDPTSGTWAAGAPLPVARVGHTATTLADGRVLVAGGEVVNGTEQAATTTTVFFDPTSAQWSAGPDMLVAATEHKAALLPNGKVLVVMSSSAQELDLAGAGSWSKTPNIPLDTTAFLFAVSPAATGKAIVAGGYQFATIGFVYQSAYALYDIASRTWTKSPRSMNAARAKLAPIVLADGKVLAAGGENGGTVPEQSAEVYEWATDTWTPVASMTAGRSAAGVLFLPSGFALIAGGVGGVTTELFAPAAGTWSPGGDLLEPRSDFPVVALPSGQALAVGGDGSDGPLASTEVFGAAAGKACAVDGQCLTGHCADGVCCATTCDGDCVACSAAAKGSGSDGTCEPVATGHDPRARCGASKVETCGASGLGCNGAGQCLRYGGETTCRPRQCTGGAETTSVCDGAGTCQGHATSCGKFQCAGDSCKSACDGDADCASGYVCDTAAHDCVSATRCASDHEQQNPDGTTTDCGGYRCLGVTCVARCGSVDDCRTGYVCDQNAHCVVPSASAPADPGSCASAPARGRASSSWLAASAAVLALAGLLRRRRGK